MSDEILKQFLDDAFDGFTIGGPPTKKPAPPAAAPLLDSVWNAVVRLSAPWVRIPPSPPPLVAAQGFAGDF